MVKPDAPHNIAENPAEALRREGRDLLRPKRLIQHKPVTPLQLMQAAQSVNLVLLPPGREVAVLTDAYGQAAIACAKERPHWNVTGWVNDTKTFLNLQNLAIPGNLTFDKKPQQAKTGASPAAILAVAWAHRVFSESNYNVTALVRAVRELLDLLPEHGQLLIQDFALPEDHEQFVVLELDSEEAIYGLIEFSNAARPFAQKQLQGFFIETLPAQRTGTQRFRLQKKWAVEFYHRWRLGIAVDAPFELTTLSLEQWVSLFQQSGARVAYRTPHGVERSDAHNIERALRFFDENGVRQPLPPASFTLLVEKIPAQTSLVFYERRLSSDKAQDITIRGMKHAKDDSALDLVEISRHEDDLLPWYRDDRERLHVLVRSNVPRPIINTVPRGTPNLDGRIWAGYLIEPLAIAHVTGKSDELTAEFVAEQLQKILAPFALEFGAPQHSVDYYPAPDYLMQRVRGLLLQVTPHDPSLVFPDTETSDGLIIDVLAEDVLRAIGVGLIPDGKLEILIGNLMLQIGERPGDKGHVAQQAKLQRAIVHKKDRSEAKVPKTAKLGVHLEEYIAGDPSENLRAVRSVFAEDHAGEFGHQVGNYTEQDFIISNVLSANTAIVVPVMRDPMRGLMMSAEPRRLPIPQRLGDGEEMMHLPSFSLPESVRTIDQARMFLARQLECGADDLHVLGPSFFVQSQISAERIYPFLLTAPVQGTIYMRWFKPMGSVHKLIKRQVEKSAAYVEYFATRILGEWNTGFTPEVIHGLTSKAAAAAPVPAAQILSQHPAAQPKIS